METVVFVHGLWMPGYEMTLLRRRVQDCGFAPAQFRYPSIRGSVIDNAADLLAFVQGLASDTVHFVGHSLGGLVIRRLFHDFPDQRPGRIVTLGTPHAGSHSARKFAESRFGRWLVGASLQGALAGDMPPWSGERELGVIAGTTNVGLSRLYSRFPGPGDGVVGLSETQLPGAADRIEVKTFHLGLLFSSEVARQTCIFLKNGHFEH